MGENISSGILDMQKEQHLTSSNFVRDIVIGISDGLTVPFALAAGLSGANVDANIIAIAGLALIVIGSIAIGIGAYLSGNAQLKHFRFEAKREYFELENLRKKELEETKEFFASIGLSESVQEQATQEVSEDKDRWVNFMMKYELGSDKPDPKRAIKSALNIGVSYIIGGLIPIIPYLLFNDNMEALKYAAVASLIFLFIFGYFKSKITDQKPLQGAIRFTVIGAVAAAAAFGVAKLF